MVLYIIDIYNIYIINFKIAFQPTSIREATLCFFVVNIEFTFLSKML